jgi:hypothetical protein
MQNVDQTIIAQFQNSPTLRQLIENANTYLDPGPDIDNFYNYVWNVATAQGYGLDVWGRIVGVSRVLQVANDGAFGFAEARPGVAGFGQGVFGTGGPTTVSYALQDSDFRTLIYAKALANISDCSIPSINNILLQLFPGRGNCYCTDGLDGTMTYTFSFSLTAVELAIIFQSGAVPKPAGVRFTVVSN